MPQLSEVCQNTRELPNKTQVCEPDIKWEETVAASNPKWTCFGSEWSRRLADT